MIEDFPVKVPVLTDALVAKIHADNVEAGQKDRAFKTSFRHSDAGACARKMAYAMLEVPQSNPPDIAGEWVMWLGTLLHEKLQGALHDRFGSACEVEVKIRHGWLSSGHIDCVVNNVPGFGRVAYELKTKGGYGFNKAIGLDRKAYATKFPEGPGAGAKIQGALNASAVDADWLFIGIIGLEAVSKQLASRIGFDDLSRVMAEWQYDKATYGPWALNELDRMREIASFVEGGALPSGSAIGDEFETVQLNPSIHQANWRCVYCSYQDQCLSDGPGIVATKEGHGNR